MSKAEQVAAQRELQRILQTLDRDTLVRAIASLVRERRGDARRFVEMRSTVPRRDDEDED